MKSEDLLKFLTPQEWFKILDRVKFFWLRHPQFPGGVYGSIRQMYPSQDFSDANLAYIEERIYFWERIQDEVDGCSGYNADSE